MKLLRIALAVIALAGCGGGSTTTTPVPGGGLTVSPAGAEYIGTTDVCAKHPADFCERAPGVGFDLSVSQAGNAANFQATSADPTVATGTLLMTGPGGTGEPVIEMNPHKAGTTALQITGNNGAEVNVPVTVTTVSSMTITFNGLPTATYMTMSASAPPYPECTSFEGGYGTNGPVPAPGSNTVVILNWPAMGTGPFARCVFTTANFMVQDANDAVIANKTVTIPITLGQDNPAAVTIP